MHRLKLLLLLAGLASAQSRASDFSYTGTFAQDDDKREFFFTLSQAGTVTLRTYSYAGGTNASGAVIPRGGFDPTLTLFDSGGNTITLNRDGGCAQVAADSVTLACWDAFLRTQLPAGTYRAVLTQGDNLANGATLNESFYYSGQGNFTQAPSGATPGFWDFSTTQRSPSYAFDIQGATSAVSPAITSSPNVPSGVTGMSYGPAVLTVQGGPGVIYTWSVIASTDTTGLPGGITLSASGVLQGTPAAPGAYTFLAQADDGVQPLRQRVTLMVYSPLSITTSSLPGGTAGQSYGSFQLAATGGSGTYSWSSTTLPAGLTLSSSGAISGSPQAAGSFNVRVNLADTTASLTASATFSLAIGSPAPAPLQISGATSLPETGVGSSVSASFTGSGGTPPYSYSAQGLPGGLAIATSTGAVSGTATQAGVFNLTVQVSDSAGRTNSITTTVSILGITTTTLGGATTTAPYSQSLTAAGGVAPYLFSATGVPAGLALSASGVFSGTAQLAGNYPLAVTIRDGVGVSASVNLVLAVTGPSPLTVSGGPLSNATRTVAYSDNLRATGGTPPYTWTVVSGALPDGLILSTSGAVSGTPGTDASFTFTAQAKDAAGAVATGVYTISVSEATLNLPSGTLPAAVLGSDYPLQILPATGGVPPYAFTLTSGTLPAGLSLGSGQISGVPTATGNPNFGITVTDSATPAKTAIGNFSILVKPSQADLILSSTSLPFTLMNGATSLPTPDNVTIRSSVIQQLIGYTFAVTPSVPWLTVTSGATTPGSMTVALNAAALALAPAATPYTASVSVSCGAGSPCAANPAQTIAVALTVTAAPAQLSLTSTLLAFSSSPAAPVPQSQTLGVKNTGGGTLAITSITPADSWIQLTGVPNAISSGAATAITVSVDPTGLAAGFYRSSINVVSGAGNASVPVTLLVAPNNTVILDPAGTQFRTDAGSAPGNPGGSFQVSVAGNSPVNFSAGVLPGANWLSTSTTSGTATSAVPGLVNFAVDPVAVASLAPGAYYGLIRVLSNDAVDSPLDFEVVLNIQRATTPVYPDPQPAGAIVTSPTGVATTQSSQIQVFASSATAVQYQASATTSDGANWLSVSPATGTASSGAPGSSTITFSPVSLAAGVYRGGVSYAFSSAAVRTVNVTLVVTSNSTGQTLSAQAVFAPDVISGAAASSCKPSKLVPTQTGLVTNFAQPTAWPTPLNIKVIDDCGSAVPNGQVVVTFSNGDPPLALTAVDTSSGNYSGTWTPRNTSGQVTLLARSTAPGFAATTTQITGEVTANSAPLLTPNGTLHVFAPLVGGSLGPGNIVQIYGANLAAQTAVSSVLPLTTALGGTTVLIGGIPAPLYYVSAGQINAQVPFELSSNKKYQIIVSANGALTTPDNLQLTSVSPGVAAFPSGLIIAQHLDGSLVSEALPAKPGEIVIFYLAGLGATDNPVVTGAASPSSPLARPVDPPAVTVNGTTAQVLFVGLTPGLVGLYQVNLQVPPTLPNGDLQLVVSQSGLPANVTVLPVHN